MNHLSVLGPVIVDDLEQAAEHLSIELIALIVALFAVSIIFTFVKSRR
ncbi:MAG: hypothetical protein J6K63_02945 [Clostridia bacterium]|nr:hypothetical protein [Clostridia bacterium]